MIKLKHNKLRNTGLFFEILSKNVLHEALSPDKPQLAFKIIRKHFTQKSELLKELNLYRTLCVDTEHNPEELLNLTLESRKKIDNKQLENEKYNLIKSIKRSYDLNEFFSSRIQNYKTLASIYKLLEYDGTDSPIDYLDTKKSLLESLTRKIENPESDVDVVLKNEDVDTRTLGFKFIIEKFNQKYSDLNKKQKILLSKYINEDTSSVSFKNYLFEEVDSIIKKLNSLINKIDDDVLKVKLTEVINLTHQIKISKNIKDEHLNAMLKYYQLIEELK